MCHITIPDSVVSIGKNALATELTDVVIPDSVVYIGEGAFAGGCFTSITIPSSVISIGNGAFSGCRSLTDVYISGNVRTIGGGTFYNCPNLTHVIMEEGITEIDEYAFSLCGSLASIKIPSSIKVIREGTFENCGGLTDVEISGEITVIEKNAFRKDFSLKNINIPGSITMIGSYAFDGCSSLTNVYYSGTEEQWKATAVDIGNLALINAMNHTNINISNEQNISNGQQVLIPLGKNHAYAGQFEIKAIEGYSGTVTWTSSDPTVFNLCDNPFKEFRGSSTKIDIYGDALAPGKSTITITTSDGVSASFDVIVRGEVGLLREWNPQTKKAVIGSVFSGNYLITEETTLPVDDLSSMVGDYVLVTADTTEGSGYGDKKAISIQPVTSRIGTLTDATDSSVTIDGAVFQSVAKKPMLMGGEIPVVYHTYQGVVVSLMFPEEKTGMFDEWSSGVATIAGKEYPVGNLADKSFLNNIAQFIGWDVKCLVLDGYLIRMSQEDSKQIVAKQFQSYDQTSRRVFFNDNTSYLLDSNTVWDSTGLVKDCWVLCTIQNTSEGIRLKKIEKVMPKVDIVVNINHGLGTKIEYDNGKFRFAGDKQYQGASGFEIPFSVTISNSTAINKIQVSGVSQSQLQADSTLSFMLNDITTNVSDGFNFGWLKGGTFELKEPVKLIPGQSISASGYIRPDALYKIGAVKKDYSITVNAKTSIGNQSGSQAFTVVDKNAQNEEEEKKITELAKAASEKLSEVDIDSMGLRDDIMKELGITGDNLELFKKELFTKIILSNAPKKTFEQKINDKILEKVLSYKPNMNAERYELPLYYVIETPEYGTVNLKLLCEVDNFSLSGSKYGCYATINYEVMDSDQYIPYKKGTLGNVAYADVKAFSDAAYNLAEAEIKKAYEETWGNSAEEVAKYLFGDTVTKILKDNKTSYKDIAWKVMTWPAKNIKNACPTNVYIYNADGKLCGAIENAQITKISDDFKLSVENDIKYITGLREGYRVEYAATANGVMDVEVTELSDYATPIRQVNHYDVPLTVGKTYKQNISETMLLTPKNYKLISESNKEVFPNKDDVFVTYATVEEKLPESSGDSGSSGSNDSGNSGSNGNGGSGSGGSGSGSGSGGGGGGSRGGGGSGRVSGQSSSGGPGSSLPSYVEKGEWTMFDGFWRFADTSGNIKVNTWTAAYNPYAAAGQQNYDWFRFDINGNMLTGWFADVDGNRYFLNPLSDGTMGRMMTGWVWIMDEFGVQRCYYFNPNSDGYRGKLLTNTIVEGYTVDENGCWTVNGVLQTK